jgi:hypothetical protein
MPPVLLAREALKSALNPAHPQAVSQEVPRLRMGL